MLTTCNDRRYRKETTGNYREGNKQSKKKGLNIICKNEKLCLSAKRTAQVDIYSLASS